MMWQSLAIAPMLHISSKRHLLQGALAIIESLKGSRFFLLLRANQGEVLKHFHTKDALEHIPKCINDTCIYIQLQFAEYYIYNGLKMTNICRIIRTHERES